MLTKEQEQCNYHTLRHIERVRNLLNIFAIELLHRGELHDQSKLESPEVEYFTEFTSKLHSTKFPSKEYDEAKAAMKPALDHHYARNRHHPEHYKNGIDDMNLIDLMEMMVDWKASSERQMDGNIRKSLEVNAARFGITPQLFKILENTIDLFDK